MKIKQQTQMMSKIGTMSYLHRIFYSSIIAENNETSPNIKRKIAKN